MNTATGRGMSLRSLYMLRQAGALRGIQSPRENYAGSVADRQLAELAAQLERAPQPSWRVSSPTLLLPAVNSRAVAAGAIDLAALAIAPAIPGNLPINVGAPGMSRPVLAMTPQFNLGQSGPAPGIGNTPFPSFGSGPTPPARGGSSDQPQLPVPPTGLPLPPNVAPPIELPPQTPPAPAPPAPGPAPSTPASSSNLPWLIGGGAVLAFLFFGKRDKRRRR